MDPAGKNIEIIINMGIKFVFNTMKLCEIDIYGGHVQEKLYVFESEKKGEIKLGSHRPLGRVLGVRYDEY